MKNIKAKTKCKYIQKEWTCCGGMEGRGGERAKLFKCQYPLKVQARPPQDQRQATQSRVSGQEGLDVNVLLVISFY